GRGLRVSAPGRGHARGRPGAEPAARVVALAQGRDSGAPIELVDAPVVDGRDQDAGRVCAEVDDGNAHAEAVVCTAWRLASSPLPPTRARSRTSNCPTPMVSRCGWGRCGRPSPSCSSGCVTTAERTVATTRF